MTDKRKKDINWVVADDHGQTLTWAEVQVAVLMDIRDELKVVRQRLSVLECPNFLDIPRKLDRIKRNTAKKRKTKTVGKPKLRVVR